MSFIKTEESVFLYVCDIIVLQTHDTQKSRLHLTEQNQIHRKFVNSSEIY